MNPAVVLWDSGFTLLPQERLQVVAWLRRTSKPGETWPLNPAEWTTSDNIESENELLALTGMSHPTRREKSDWESKDLCVPVQLLSLQTLCNLEKLSLWGNSARQKQQLSGSPTFYGQFLTKNLRSRIQTTISFTQWNKTWGDVSQNSCKSFPQRPWWRRQDQAWSASSCGKFKCGWKIKCP